MATTSASPCAALSAFSNQTFRRRLLLLTVKKLPWL